MDNRILYIDDDVDDQLIFRELIQEMDGRIECLTARNGLDALDLLTNTQSLPSLIFLDLNMPFISGWECMQRIKMNEKLSNIPIVILTTSDNGSDRIKAREKGARLLLTKTADLNAFRKNLHQILIAEKLLSQQ